MTPLKRPFPARVTIKDVARESGVSTQTVSRVLNNRPDVAPETRQRVSEVIAQLKFRPSQLARSMIQQRSLTLGVIVASLKYSGVVRTLYGIMEQAENSDYSVLVKELHSFSEQDYHRVIDPLLRHEVEGIIYAVPEIRGDLAKIQSQLEGIHTPVVYIRRKPRPTSHTIAVDNQAGAQMAVNHLLSQGCRRIAHISGPLHWWEAAERKQGWQDALRAAGLPAEKRHSVAGDWTSASGARAFQELLVKYPELDAIFAANDQMALGVLNAAQASGLRIPADLAVVGFDDLAEAAYFCPSLTTVRQDLPRLGALAVEKVFQIINQPTSPVSFSLVLPPELIIRDSSIKTS